MSGNLAGSLLTALLQGQETHWVMSYHFNILVHSRLHSSIFNFNIRQRDIVFRFCYNDWVCLCVCLVVKVQNKIYNIDVLFWLFLIFWVEQCVYIFIVYFIVYLSGNFICNFFYYENNVESNRFFFNHWTWNLDIILYYKIPSQKITTLKT